MHLAIVIGFAAFILLALLYGLRDLARAFNHLISEVNCCARIQLERQRLADPHEFARALPNLASDEQLAGRCAREVFAVVSAGSNIDQAAIRDRVLRELEDRPQFARGIANLAVYIGLLGTLIGLVMAVMALNQVPPIEKPEDLKLFGEVTRDMFSSFGVAFASAGAGIVTTVVLAWRLAVYDSKSSAAATEVEKVCAQTIMPLALNISRPSNPKAIEEMYRKLMEEQREAATNAAALFAEVAGDLGQTVAELREAVGSVKVLGTKLTTAASSIESAGHQQASVARDLDASTQALSLAADNVAKSANSFAGYAEGWDAAPVREANQRMGTILPGLQSELARQSKEQSDMLDRATREVRALLEETKSMINGQASLLTALDSASRDAFQAMGRVMQQSNAATPVNISSPGSSTDSREVVDLLRRIAGEMSVLRGQSGVTAQNSSGETVVVQPIPGEVVASLENISRTLSRIEEQNQAHYRAVHHAQVLAQQKPPAIQWFLDKWAKVFKSK